MITAPTAMFLLSIVNQMTLNPLDPEAEANLKVIRLAKEELEAVLIESAKVATPPVQETPSPDEHSNA